MRPSRSMLFCLTACMFSAFIPQSLSGQTVKNHNHGSAATEDPFVVPKTDIKITVDALLDEYAWQDALVLELSYEIRPGENVTPPVSAEVLLTYDANNLYAAFRCYDPDPSPLGPTSEIVIRWVEMTGLPRSWSIQ